MFVQLFHLAKIQFYEKLYGRKYVEKRKDVNLEKSEEEKIIANKSK